MGQATASTVERVIVTPGRRLIPTKSRRRYALSIAVDQNIARKPSGWEVSRMGPRRDCISRHSILRVSPKGETCVRIVDSFSRFCVDRFISSLKPDIIIAFSLAGWEVAICIPNSSVWYIRRNYQREAWAASIYKIDSGLIARVHIEV